MTFDRLAPIYGLLEKLTAGPRLQRARIHWLDALAGRRRLLSAGEGHGRFAAACAARHPGLELTCLDSSAGMLRQARAATGPHAARINWVVADLPVGRPPCPGTVGVAGAATYDAIATCFFLDCFPPDTLRQVVDQLAASATGDACWLVVDFAIPRSGLARARARVVHWIMYTFFCLAVNLPARRLVDPAPYLMAQGFELRGRQSFNWGLIQADLWERRTFREERLTLNV